MEFHTWLEANYPWFFANRGRSLDDEWLRHTYRISPRAVKIYRMMDKRLVKFIVDEVIDELMKELTEGGEDEHMLTIMHLLDEEIPYYGDPGDEDRSVPRKWVGKLENFIDVQLGQNPKIRAYIQSPEFQDQKPKWQSAKDFASNFTSDIFHLFEMEIGQMIRGEVIKKFGNADFVISIYGVSQGYGGPEEGGWWYDHKDLIHQIPIKGLRKAYRRWKELKRMYQTKGQDSFMKDMMRGHGGARDITGSDDWGPEYSGPDQEGMDIPRGWTTSEYKRYDIELQLAGSPTKETGAPPHYQ